MSSEDSDTTVNQTSEWSVNVRAEHVARLREMIEKAEVAMTPQSLIQFQLGSVVERIMEGEYDPFKLIANVGGRKETGRRRLDITLNVSREKLEEVAQTVNEDLDLAYVNNYRAKPTRSVDTWPTVPCTAPTVIRATIWEVVEQSEVLSEDMIGMTAKELRQSDKE